MLRTFFIAIYFVIILCIDIKGREPALSAVILLNEVASTRRTRLAESNLVLDAVLRKTSLKGEDFTLERAAGEGEEGRKEEVV